MNLEQYKAQFTEDDAVGWLAIDKKLEEFYPNQEPQHFAPIISYMFGGENPLNGISVYNSAKQTDHLHFVTYGFSELYYDEESAGS